MACGCKGKKSSKGVTHYSLPVYTIIAEMDKSIERRMIVSTTSPIIVDRGGVKINVSSMSPRSFFLTEIQQLLELEAPIYVYD